jgi:hypothetical protein
MMRAMPTLPQSTTTSPHQRLSARARDRWPALSSAQVRFRGAFAYNVIAPAAYGTDGPGVANGSGLVAVDGR